MLFRNFYVNQKSKKQIQVSCGKSEENQIWKNHMVDCFPGINYIAGENVVPRVHTYTIQYKPHIQTVYKEKLYINDK